MLACGCKCCGALASVLRLADNGARLSFRTILAGILLHGPPGCSKTLLARAVASQARLNFISVKVRGALCAMLYLAVDSTAANPACGSLAPNQHALNADSCFGTICYICQTVALSHANRGLSCTASTWARARRRLPPCSPSEQALVGVPCLDCCHCC